MNPQLKLMEARTRRYFLQNSCLGLGGIALGSLAQLPHGLSADPMSVRNPLSPRKSPLPDKAKRVIYLHMTGSPPNFDLFDPKPELSKRDGQDCPDAFLKD